MLPKQVSENGLEEESSSYPLLGVALKNEALKDLLLKERRENQAEGGGEAEEKARARLTSSKILADEVNKGVETLNSILGLETKVKRVKEEEKEMEVIQKPKEKEKKKKKSEETQEGGDKESSSKEMDKGKGKKKEKTKVDSTSWMETRSWSGSDGEDASEGEDYQYPLKKGVESNQDEESDQEDESDKEDQDQDQDHEVQFGDEWDALVAPPSSAEGSDSEDEEGEDSGSESDSSTKNLPALSSGFIQSGLSLRPKKRKGRDEGSEEESESEWSDAEADLMEVESDAEEGGKAKGSKKDMGSRKNRMGQRARKA